MKICSKCKEEKDEIDFSPDKRYNDGFYPSCKVCKGKVVKKYRKTKEGVLTKIYNSQILSSKKRKHDRPQYTKGELKTWLFCQIKFHELYSEWVNHGYKKELIPSIDRLDDSKGYSFENIQLMTWGENYIKGKESQRFGLVKSAFKLRPVIKLDLYGNFIDEYISISEAGRKNNMYWQNISKCCRGIYNTSGGFKWKYKE